MDDLLPHAGITPALSESRLLLSAEQSAKLCGTSLRTWRSYSSGGRIPQPVRIGRRTLWRHEELCNWVAAGCPCREEWEARR